MATSRRLVQFSNGLKIPQDKNIRVVYVDGAFDVLHCGHVEILQQARQMGDFVLVGIHSDNEVRKRRGKAYPILGLYERTLSVLACQYVDEVIIGAPSILNSHMIKTFNISLVLRGNVSESRRNDMKPSLRYQVPMQQGIFKRIQTGNFMTTQTLIDRVMENQETYEVRNDSKLPSAGRYAQQEQYAMEL
eukprot:TRINITY_DN4361_c0_g1_i1.p3 TRINITY_DN4361_c0_g1~~TRINITY_DN4361_c0_g1_i1.p3  ORF type:complete len:190 (-),score=13.57 TRINITY_DN4361_c0_g1_i1:462-1031(-)